MDIVPHSHACLRMFFQVINTPDMRVTRNTIEFVIVRVCTSGELSEIINIENTDMEIAKSFAESLVPFITFTCPLVYEIFRLFTEVRLMLQPIVVCCMMQTLAAHFIEVGIFSQVVLTGSYIIQIKDIDAYYFGTRGPPGLRTVKIFTLHVGEGISKPFLIDWTGQIKKNECRKHIHRGSVAVYTHKFDGGYDILMFQTRGLLLSTMHMTPYQHNTILGILRCTIQFM